MSQTSAISARETRRYKNEVFRIFLLSQVGHCMQEVCGWINAKATKPVWAKMTPNITDIALPARTALSAGCEGVAAINTITSVMGINLETLRPEPSVEGYSTPGGYSSRAVKPIALAKVSSIRLACMLT